MTTDKYNNQAKITQHLIPGGVASTQIPIVSGVLPKEVRYLLRILMIFTQLLY